MREFRAKRLKGHMNPHRYPDHLHHRHYHHHHNVISEMKAKSELQPSLFFGMVLEICGEEFIQKVRTDYKMSFAV